MKRIIGGDTLEVEGEGIVKVAAAVSSPTRYKILKNVQGKEMDLGEVAKIIGQSKANASAQVRILERSDLVKVIYRPGQRGVKKTCILNVNEIRLKI